MRKYAAGHASRPCGHRPCHMALGHLGHYVASHIALDHRMGPRPSGPMGPGPMEPTKGPMDPWALGPPPPPPSRPGAQGPGWDGPMGPAGAHPRGRRGCGQELSTYARNPPSLCPPLRVVSSFIDFVHFSLVTSERPVGLLRLKLEVEALHKRAGLHVHLRHALRSSVAT